MGCAAGRIGAATGLAPTGAGRGRCNFGRAGVTGGVSFDWEVSLSICPCNLLRPLATSTITAMISQIRVSMSACFTMLAGRPGLAGVVTGD